MTDLLWKIDGDKQVKLKDYDPSYIDKRTERDQARDEMAQLDAELNELQGLMSAAQQHSLLMLLQGMDTSGKDGTIRHVLADVNPQGCVVHSFKQPTPDELAHDFLWRIHQAAPGKGTMSIFNRSQYEDVLIVRVHNLVAKDVWTERYKQINQFEKLLVSNNTIIVKFFLHISKEEQKERLLEREKDKDKAWKLSSSDWTERQYWDDYQEAYEDLLNKCSSDVAPWYIVPANRKWYRNLAIAQTLVQTMRQYKDEWRASLEQRGKVQLAELAQMRARKQADK